MEYAKESRDQHFSRQQTSRSIQYQQKSDLCLELQDKEEIERFQTTEKLQEAKIDSIIPQEIKVQKLIKNKALYNLENLQTQQNLPRMQDKNKELKEIQLKKKHSNLRRQQSKRDYKEKNTKAGRSYEKILEALDDEEIVTQTTSLSLIFDLKKQISFDQSRIDDSQAQKSQESSIIQQTPKIQEVEEQKMQNVNDQQQAQRDIKTMPSFMISLNIFLISFSAYLSFISTCQTQIKGSTSLVQALLITFTCVKALNLILDILSFITKRNIQVSCLKNRCVQ